MIFSPRTQQTRRVLVDVNVPPKKPEFVSDEVRRVGLMLYCTCGSKIVFFLLPGGGVPRRRAVVQDWVHLRVVDEVNTYHVAEPCTESSIIVW